jgi:hypothetical protein
MRHLHPKDRELFRAVKSILEGMAEKYDLPLKEVVPVPRGKIVDRYGDCSQTGRVRIALRNFDGKKWANKRERPWTIVQTMAHELAHLRHFNHKDYWMILFSDIMREMATFGVLDRVRKLCKNR